MGYPIPSSSDDSNGVPQRRQMTAEQSPQVSGSETSSPQVGQYSSCGSRCGAGSGLGAMRSVRVAYIACRFVFNSIEYFGTWKKFWTEKPQTPDEKLQHEFHCWPQPCDGAKMQYHQTQI